MAETDAGSLKLDVCRICHFIWFDAQEFEQMPVPKRSDLLRTVPEVPQKAKEAIALYEVQRAAEELRETEPPELWQHVPAIFGLPVERENPSLSRHPATTWVLALIIGLTSVLAFTDLSHAVATFGLIPAEAFRVGGLTFLTSFFVHGGIMHLVGNLYFFLIFGDNVEDYLGPRRFLVLLLAATLMGGVIHVLADPFSKVPCVGASGGISGIITFYALQFPNVRVGLLIRFRWVHMRAWVAFALWIGLQCIGVWRQMAGLSNVSATAHLGGAAAGLFAWLLWRKELGANDVQNSGAS